MALLGCIHNVSWVVPVEGGKHQCLYCRELVTKKQLYPKFEDLGPDYQKAWDAHEPPAPAPPAKPAAPAKPAEPKPDAKA